MVKGLQYLSKQIKTSCKSYYLSMSFFASHSFKSHVIFLGDTLQEFYSLAFFLTGRQETGCCPILPVVGTKGNKNGPWSQTDLD